MTKQILKKASSLLIVMVFAFSLVLVSNVSAQVGQGIGWDTQSGSANQTTWGNTAENIQQRAALGNDDPRNIAANVINIILGFLGILAVVLILYGGFKWMTAAGNEDKVSEAKKLLVAGVIGLIIILAAFALSTFILDAVFRATTSGEYIEP